MWSPKILRYGVPVTLNRSGKLQWKCVFILKFPFILWTSGNFAQLNCLLNVWTQVIRKLMATLVHLTTMHVVAEKSDLCCTCQPVAWNCNFFQVSFNGVKSHMSLGSALNHVQQVKTMLLHKNHEMHNVTTGRMKLVVNKLSHRTVARGWVFGVERESSWHRNKELFVYGFINCHCTTYFCTFQNFTITSSSKKPYSNKTRNRFTKKTLSFHLTTFPYCAVVSPSYHYVRWSSLPEGNRRRLSCVTKGQHEGWRRDVERLSQTSASVLFLESCLYPSCLSFRTTNVSPTPSCSNRILA